ncbi:MAG: sterol desaturase family protein [Paraglaciecola sp.]|nr:sterol desaturase family protein [Paraglaciecola sp.]
MMLWEWRRPNRHSVVKKSQRWASNFTLVLLGALVARLIVPTGLATVAIWAQQNNIGLWNQLDCSLFCSVLLSVVLFDCAIYWQHRLFHRVPILWRLHKVHHADPHLDASTGLRFHPIEIALSIVIKILIVLLLGAPLMAILIFEVLLNATSMFNHTNIKLPNKIERPLRKIMVTQAMHRIHHSQVVCETDSNFGFNLSIWDRLFASYIDEAQKGDEGIKLGLKEYASPQSNTSLKALLLMPFRRPPNL